MFPGRNGTPLDNVQKAWSSLLRRAGIRGLRWHDMGHPFASRLVMAGVNLYVVKELLGHSPVRMTERYAHLAPEHHAQAVALLTEARV